MFEFSPTTVLTKNLTVFQHRSAYFYSLLKLWKSLEVFGHLVADIPASGPEGH